MDKVNKLIGYTEDVLYNRKRPDNYDCVYFHSNENLRAIFNEIDVANRDVLTVLGSGDQALYMYDRGARSVDLFDKNNLTLYYYYLRVWTIKYLNQFYPDIHFDNNFLERLLQYVEPKTEAEKIAYLYWKKFSWYFEDCDYDDLDDLFIIGNDIKGNELYDFYRIKSKVEKEKYNFYNIDIVTPNLNLNKKYDAIYVSNIGDRVNSKEEIRIYRDNLFRHLKDDGIVVGANVIRDLRNNMDCIFREIFDVKTIDKSFYKMDYRSPGYIYKKRG